MNCAFLDHLAAKMHLRFIAGKKALFHEKKSAGNCSFSFTRCSLVVNRASDFCVGGSDGCKAGFLWMSRRTRRWRRAEQFVISGLPELLPWLVFAYGRHEPFVCLLQGNCISWTHLNWRLIKRQRQVENGWCSGRLEGQFCWRSQMLFVTDVARY
jgi:hypothetical protein